MKKISIQIPKSETKTRVHYVLFMENTPFKPKQVNLKNRYKRNEKHRNKETV
jgi:hypothetical protein